MAHYVQIPKDLNDIKEKFIMGFTKRQVICFGIGLVLGAPVFFLTKTAIGMSGAIFAMGAVAALRYSADFIRKMAFSWRNRQNICVNTLQDLESGITAQQTYLSALKGISNTQESRKS